MPADQITGHSPPTDWLTDLLTHSLIQRIIIIMISESKWPCDTTRCYIMGYLLLLPLYLLLIFRGMSRHEIGKWCPEGVQDQLIGNCCSWCSAESFVWQCIKFTYHVAATGQTIVSIYWTKPTIDPPTTYRANTNLTKSANACEWFANRTTTIHFTGVQWRHPQLTPRLCSSFSSSTPTDRPTDRMHR